MVASDIFNTAPSNWSFAAIPSPYLYDTDLAPLLPTKVAGKVAPKSTRDSRYWARVTKGMDASSEDKFYFARYNRVLCLPRFFGGSTGSGLYDLIRSVDYNPGRPR